MPPPPTTTFFRTLYLRWKSLHLPWRRQFLVGSDLSGSLTFWEFRDTADPTRMRRIVKGHRKLQHSDVQISPQWHQWLRRTRADPPSLQEQSSDIVRQVQLKEGARLADERWAGKKRYIEDQKPEMRQQEPQKTTMGGNPELGRGQKTIDGGNTPKTEPVHKEGVRQGSATGKEMKDPWEEESQRQKRDTATNPGAGWQPEAWSPGGSASRRQ